MKLSASKAAKETGTSVPTITRAIKSGKLSATKLEGGGYEIDPAELFRAFPPITANRNDAPSMLGSETPISDRVLQAENEMLRERLADKDNVIDDLRRRLDQEAEERRKLTAMLTYKPETPVPAPAAVPDRGKRSWWPFGRSND